jgi:hypothetical protein
MNQTSFTPSSWAAQLGPAAASVALALLWRFKTGQIGDGARDRSRGDGLAGGEAVAASPAAGDGRWDEARDGSLGRLSLTRVRRRDDPRDELSRLGLLLPAVGEDGGDEIR